MGTEPESVIRGKNSFLLLPLFPLILLVVLIFLLDFHYGRPLLLGLLIALISVRLHNGRPRSRSSKDTDSLPGDACLELARRHSRFNLSEQGQTYYRMAVERFFQLEEMDKALGAFSEFFDLYQKVFEPRFQLKLCHELYRRGYYELSARALETLIEEWDEVAGGIEPVWKEKVYLRLGRILAEKVDCPDYARWLFSQFIEKFPGSRFRGIVEYQLMALEAKMAEKRLKRAA
jgi:tetratricopeptide (TPR) repeat protein